LIVLLFKLIWAGLRDTFRQFMMFALLSLCWWLAALLIIPGPPATTALMAMADPRRMGAAPEFGDAIEVFKSSWKRSWGLAAFTLPFLIMLVWNLTFFGGVDSYFAAMVPLWTIMFILLFIIALYAFSMAGTMESGVRNAFRGAMFVLVSRPFVSIFLAGFLLFLTLVLAVMVIPMLLFGPALIASIINRTTLTVLGEPIEDPDAPTPERADERARGVNPDPSLIGRFRRNQGQKGR
jgi:uncharacterized membrane protein YesL